MKKEVSVWKVKVEIADVAGHTTCQSSSLVGGVEHMATCLLTCRVTMRLMLVSEGGGHATKVPFSPYVRR